MNQMNTATRREIKQCHAKRLTTHDHTQMAKSQRKNLDLCENHLFKLKYREKDEDRWFQVKNWPKTTINKEVRREKTRADL